MSEQIVNVTAEYIAANIAAEKFNPGEQPDIAALMRAAYKHGYAQALIDLKQPRTFADCGHTVHGLAVSLLERCPACETY